MTRRQWMMLVMLALCIGWIPLLFIPTAAKKDPKALVAQLPSPYDAGDPVRGQDAFKACVACHTTTEHGQKLNGPNLHRLFGRRAAAKADFAYSPAMKAAPFRWDAKRLDAFLADPRAAVPGTAMAIPGVKDPKARIDLIPFLKVATS